MIYELNLGTGVPQTGYGEVFYLPPPVESYTLRLLIPATSPIAQQGTVHINHPPRGQKFDRGMFYDYKLKDSSLHSNLSVDIEIHQSGPYTVYTSYTQIEGHFGAVEKKQAKTPEWNFIVSPHMELNRQPVTPNEFTVQTVLAKLMGGPVEHWAKNLDAIAAKNYNMIHFVPLQPRGESDSPFSLSDQLGWDTKIFPNGEQDIERLVSMLADRGILALSDVVLNHTANTSEWLEEHPEVGYTAETSPHLKAAIELDTGLLEYSAEISGQKIETWDDIVKIGAGVEEHVINKRKLWEYYVIDSAQLEKCVEQHPFEGRPPHDLPTELNVLAKQLVDKAGVDIGTFGDRFARRVDSSVLAEYVAGSAFSAKQIIDEINLQLYREYDADKTTILTEIKNRLKYLRLDEHGPKWGAEITKEKPIAEPYFTRVKTANGIVEMANNGWVWAANPLVDFAGPDSKAYLTRQVIIWGDCVKLRYGSGPEACPYLWERMTQYTQLLAKHFSGLRIDNCHSTPLHVGSYLLDKARLVRPELYVVAELFSGSQEMDKLYVEKLGITSLLREAIQPDSVKDLSTQVNVNGGLPIGSFIHGEVLENQPVVHVSSQRIHSWLMECTHDNETFAQKRTVEDTLSSAGLVAFCQVASGCTMGNDECYPVGLNVVSEERPYVFGGGITEAKSVLNKLHTQMGKMNAFESFTDHQNQYITVNRINPETGDGYFLIARTAFHGGQGEDQLGEVFLEKTSAEWYAGWSLQGGESPKESEDHIEPIKTELRTLEPFNTDFDGASTKIYPAASKDFPPGSVAIYKVSRTFDAKKLEDLVRKGQHEAVSELNLLDLSVLLYRCNTEERAATEGKLGVYEVPNHGPLIYAGLQGWETPLRSIVEKNDLGAAICDNLRQGEWAFYSTIDRLKYYLGQGLRFEKIIGWLSDRVDALKEIPSFLRPRYFAAVFLGLYDAAVARAMSLMPSGIGEADFMTKLSLVSLQMVTNLPGASLAPLSQVPSMAAGLPHFSEGIMRCWGRDVFLSVGGLLHETGRYDEAKQHIISFGSTLKHGLIPNLLDAGRNPRYNCRDAVWFFVQSIQDYCNHTKSLDILNEKIKRRFPLDDTFVEWDSPEAFAYETSVSDLIIEVLARHAAGIQFREHNAGPKIDMHMKDNGFNQKIWVDWKSGLIHGGNQDNCGTWMDKMGESPRAGSEGVPGTPRDGAAVEIIGLLKSCLRWVNSLEESGQYHFSKSSVTNQDGNEVTLKHWNDLLQNNFEKYFYIPINPDDDSKYEIDSSLVNRRGIYKDLVGSGKPYEDYQLRPNYCIAIVAAPELFNLDHAVSALGMADKILCGPVGMATLDPSDWEYRPYYLNSLDNDDFKTSKGRNYHQGPEWVWNKGVLLQAMVIISKLSSMSLEETVGVLRVRLQGDVEWLNNSPWAGITELTQKNGEICGDSSPTQAWSAARIIEAITQTLVQ